jgi:protein gp37
MADKTKIAWTDATLNTAYGCTKVSPACQNCYAIGAVSRLVDFGHRDLAGAVVHSTDGSKIVTQWTGGIVLKSERMDQARRWKKPRRVFVNSLSDTFHDGIPDSHLDALWTTMAACPQHTFQILTKRPERMLSYIHGHLARGTTWREGLTGQPLPNVWLGVTVEDQEQADRRIPLLLATPAAVRFVSMEPLLGPVSLDLLPGGPDGNAVRNALDGTLFYTDADYDDDLPKLDWVIVGGESGPNARPMDPAWVRDLRDQCQAAGVPFFFKQWGEWAPHPRKDNAAGITILSPTGFRVPLAGSSEGPFWLKVGKKAAGDFLDGVQHHEWPVP